MELPPDIFITYPKKVAFKTYQTCWQIGDIYLSGNAEKTEDNPQGTGCYLVMTGRGCDDIFRILDNRGHTFGELFRQCERWFGTEFHFTRLDIAIDDRNEVPFFTPQQLKKNAKRKNTYPAVNTVGIMRANIPMKNGLELFISVLENRIYRSAFTIRTEKSAQNITERWKKSGAGNERKSS